MEIRSPGDLTVWSAVHRGDSFPRVPRGGRKVPSMTTSGAGDWVERWLSRPRFGVYLAAVGGDRPTALQLYEWNATVSAAFMRDLAHLEVALRNAYDDALTSGLPPRGMHWVFDPTRYFPTVWKTARNGARYNDNHEPQRLIAQATATALLSVQAAARTTKQAVPVTPAPGKVVAELPFGFWRYLSAAKHEKRLWVPYLHKAFAAGTSRHELDRRINRLHELRNRIAHHEPLLRRNRVTGVLSLSSRHLDDRHHDLLAVADLISPNIRDYIAATSTCATTINHRPPMQ